VEHLIHEKLFRNACPMCGVKWSLHSPELKTNHKRMHTEWKKKQREVKKSIAISEKYRLLDHFDERRNK